MLARFFAPSGISKRYFRLDLAPMVPGPIPRRIKGLRIFARSTRAHPRVRARDHQNSGLRTLVRETLTTVYLRDPLTLCRKASACLR